MQKERASKRQQELLSFVDSFIKTNGYGPSYREIMNAIGYKSVSTVAVHIDGLIAKGYLSRADKSARSLEVVTLHKDTSPPTANDTNIEAELIKRFKATKLTDDQREVVSRAFELLGYEEAKHATT